ncbi:Ig-like domain-containing protein [Duganella sp. Root1480D1]|uniref:Ig-like domain-containing protein n=1 Tax=Duganella sp. Root1480D1 TaxID=1736471 RepID=UPI00070EFC94|nr:Ig-like domain-containing protein [Duganella sp. Root1480D1]KQZ27724.1 hypothetical protein ASD58_14140 [Duganella sp. Root1480D1]
MANVVFRKLSALAGALACAGLLAACGGGGGHPGTSTTDPDPNTPKAASVLVTSSSDTIAASGVDGTEVTITATVKDSGNQAVPGATVLFKTTAGTISNSGNTTDSSGRVSEKLSVKGVTVNGVSQPVGLDIKISAGVVGVENVSSNTITIKTQ